MPFRRQPPAERRPVSHSCARPFAVPISPRLLCSAIRSRLSIGKRGKARCDRCMRRRPRGRPALAVALDRGRVLDAPMRGDRLARPDRADLAGRIVADGEDEIELGRVRRGELVPALRAKPVGREAAGRRAARSATGCTSPFGKLPAEKARKRPSPSRLSSASARIERAELPVQRNRTLYGGPLMLAAAGRGGAALAGRAACRSRGARPTSASSAGLSP